MANPKTQADQRRTLILRDQFERAWAVVVEIATGDPCGSKHPYNRWVDPLHTPQSFITVPHGDMLSGQWRVEIDFRGWIEQQERGEEEWYVELRKQAREAYKRLDPAEVGTLENDAYVRERTGPKPWPSSTVLKLAQSGDKQFLGFEKLDTEHREALGLAREDAQQIAAAAKAKVTVSAGGIPAPPDTYPDFISWAFRYQGVKDFGQGAQMWREHKAALQEV